MKKEHENQTINEVVVIDSDSSSSFWLQNAPEAKFAGKVTVCTKKEHENQTVNEVVVVDSDSSSSSWMVKAPKTEFPEQFTGLKIPIPTWAVLSEQRVAVGCYIFAEDFPPEEVLFKNRGLNLKRKDLNTLLPGMWLVDDVLTAVAYYAAKMTPIINERPIWFLPGHLSYTMLLSGNVLTYEDVVKDNRYTSLMRNSFNPRKIYIPMNDSNLHWYLAVVLMDEGIIHLVDSKSTKTRTRERIKDVEDMRPHLYMMLIAMLPPEDHDFIVPRIMEFQIVTPPNVPTQQNGDDCGLWVAHWMTHADHDYNHHEEIVPELRAVLAIRLVMDQPNSVRSTILRHVDDQIPKFRHFISRRATTIKRIDENIDKHLAGVKPDLSNEEESSKSSETNSMGTSTSSFGF
ncbi:hypothetical protein LINGRAHAP2_LOCUS3876 [Linum grandiflorum]